MNMLYTARMAVILLAFWAQPIGAQASRQEQPRSLTTEKRVAALIEKMLNRATEHQAFADLEALGCPAVPAIIHRMNDRRRLPDPYISFVNKSPDAFEALLNYGPQEVVDALAAILNQITGRHFGSIYNGATDTERTKTVQGWRDFLRKTPAAELCSNK
jgi:hypothetical protein